MAKPNKRAGKLWLYFDAGFTSDAKVIDAGERAAWLFISMMCEAKRTDTDGVLTEGQIAKLSVPGWRQRLKVLIERELVTEMPLTPGYYLISTWDQWQETTEERDLKREKWRQQKGKDSHDQPA